MGSVNDGHLAGLDASRLEVVGSSSLKQSRKDGAAPFGSTFTAHMLVVEWDSQSGWKIPRIVPFGSLALSPAANVLHYSSTCFEGMKAYRGIDGKIRLFRPSMNMARFNRSAARIGLPTVDEDTLLQLIWKLIKIDQHFISNKEGQSLYLRPTMIATTPDLSLILPKSALLFVIASPVGSYYKSGFKAINIETVSAVRAWPGGVGDFKVGSNYGPSIVPHHRAHLNGSDQTLWLIDDDRVTEANGMNIFAVIKDKITNTVELVTPPLDGLILPGITRDSVLQLGREKLAGLAFSVSERKLTMTELQDAAREERLREVFGTGTAVVICPVRNIKWRDTAFSCGLEAMQEAGPVAEQMKRWIENRQFGHEENEWGITMPM
ncbi:hypothetical protein MMC22_001195 [Lobaria immixta]|nr:hypothetical protein [Lobaria immixta]